MKINKMAIICTLLISFVAIILSILFYYRHLNYLSNLFSGIFASGTLALVIAIINYCNERRRILEHFYQYSLKVVSCYNLYENEGDMEKTIDLVLEMSKFDYTELDNAFGDIDFIFRNKKNRRYIYQSIYEITLKARHFIRDRSYHFKEYRKAFNGNSIVMKNFINEIDSFFMERTEKNFSNEDGTITKMIEKHNKIVENLHKELSGKYYIIMYPRKKYPKSR